MCAIYGQQSYGDINKLRFDMFMKKFQINSGFLITYSGIDMSLLPLCQSSLLIHIQHVNYQLFIWLHIHENNPDFADVVKSGWKTSPDRSSWSITGVKIKFCPRN